MKRKGLLFVALLLLSVFSLCFFTSCEKPHEHYSDASGFCSICELPMSATEGLIIEVSSDCTYAEVAGYSGVFTRVNIPSTYSNLPVKSICAEVFKNKHNISKVIIPDSVTNIGNSAFYDCESLTSVTFGDNSKLESIGDWAFSRCDSLTSVTIPDSVTNIGEWAFMGCVRLPALEIPRSVTSIGEGAFSKCEKIDTIKIPSSITSIGDFVFSHCYSLQSIEIPNSITSIGKQVFENCKELKSVSFEKNSKLESIGIYAFGCCKSLTSVTIPDSVTSIGSSAFYNCDSLTSVTIGNSVTSIGNYAFSGCNSSLYTTENNLKYVKANNNPYCILVEAINNNLSTYQINSQTKYIANSVFSYCERLTQITIPDSVTSIGYEAFFCCGSLTSIIVDANNLVYKSIDGNLYSKNGKELIQYAIGKTTTSFSVPDSVTSIGSSAFYYCYSLASVTISDSVTSIGRYAFYNCDSLTSVIIPDSVTSIGDWAFSNCDSLTRVTFSDTSTWYKIDGTDDNAYDNWQNKTGGFEIDVTDIYANATYFKSGYYEYLYKK